MKIYLRHFLVALILLFFVQVSLHSSGMSIHQFVAQETYNTYDSRSPSPLYNTLKAHHSVYLFAALFPDIFFAREEVKKGYNEGPGQAAILKEKLKDKTAGPILKKLMDRTGFTEADLELLIKKNPDATREKMPSWASYGGSFAHNPEFLNSYIKEIIVDCKGNAAALLLPENGRRLAHFLGAVNHIMTDTLFDLYFLQWVHKKWGKNQMTPDGKPYQIHKAGGTQTWTDYYLDFVALKRKIQVFYDTTDLKILGGKLIFKNSPIDADQGFLYRVFSKDKNFKSMETSDLKTLADSQYYAVLYQRMIALQAVWADISGQNYPEKMKECDEMLAKFPGGLDYLMYPEIKEAINPDYYKKLFSGKLLENHKGGRADCTRYNREILDRLQTILFFENRLPEFSRKGDWPDWTWEVKGVGKTLFQKGLEEIQKGLIKAGEVSKALFDSGVKAAGAAVNTIGETGKKAGTAVETSVKKGAKKGKKLGKTALDKTKKAGEVLKDIFKK